MIKSLLSKSKMNLKEIESQITTQALHVKELKSAGAVSKSELDQEVQKLLKLKQLLLENTPKPFNRSSLESLLVKRFFYAPSFQIYGGIAGLFDYGPPGSALQNNILSAWRQHFVLEEDMLELECTNLTPESVLKTSGHVDRFADYMVKDSKTGDIFRADHLVKQVLKSRLDVDDQLKKGIKVKNAEPLIPSLRQEYEIVLETLDNYQGMELYKLILKFNIKAPETGNDLTEPVLFNLMFETQIGPTGQFKGYLRPETAQGHFLNFKKLYEFNSESMPFASASIGKSFRNEISPRQGLLRVREFTMAEIEHYVDPLKKDHPRFDQVKDVVLPFYSAKDQMAGNGVQHLSMGDAVSKGIVNNQTLGYFIVRIYLFLCKIGINKDRLRFRQHMANEMAHYACDCWDAEIESSYGWIECVGCADRSAFDLSAHSRKTNEKLVAREKLSEPILSEKWVLETVGAKFGPAFKKNAVHVKKALEDLMNCDGEWDEDKLKNLKQKLDLGSGKTIIEGADGNPYEISSEMVKIYLKSEKISVREYIPNVIEPSFGIGRILYSLLEHSYYVRQGDEQRAVFSFPPSIAPTKVLVTPISHQPEFEPIISNIVTALRRAGISSKVDNSNTSIGRRYARNDELGTPFAITLDFETPKDSSFTLRERDSTSQIRVSGIEALVSILLDLISQEKTWEDVASLYPSFITNIDE